MSLTLALSLPSGCCVGPLHSSRVVGKLTNVNSISALCRRICISCSTTLARKYFWGHVDGFSIAFADLIGGDGPQFRKDCQEAGLKLYVWTVNDRDEMIEASSKLRWQLVVDQSRYAKRLSEWQVEAILTDRCTDYLELRNSMQSKLEL